MGLRQALERQMKVATSPVGSELSAQPGIAEGTTSDRHGVVCRHSGK